MTHLILLLGVLLIVAYISGSEAENAFSLYWKKHIGLPHPPYWLATKASPLSLNQVAMFAKLIEENKLTSHLHSFCNQANVACSTNSLVKEMPIPDKVRYDDLPNVSPLSISNQGGLPFFRKSMVKEGGSMAILNLRDPMLYKSFLPRSLASKIPFSFAQIEKLKMLFDVANESKMDEYIQQTLNICEKSPIKGEQSTCAASAEDLIDFVVEKLGHHVCIWSTESVEGSYENATIGTVKLIHGNLSETLALCHTLPFLFQVYYCHVLQNVKVYAVDLNVHKKVNHAIMACHHDTSTWNPNHLAFKLTGFGPGLTEVCHWINENGMIWIKTLG